MRPGLPGVSDNITVTSVVGRFLEHPRIYYFRNGGEEEMLLGSADLMPRNLDRRVETLFPIEDAEMLRSIRDKILLVHLRDNVQSWCLKQDGSYSRCPVLPDRTSSLNSQMWMVEHRGVWNGE